MLGMCAIIILRLSRLYQCNVNNCCKWGIISFHWTFSSKNPVYAKILQWMVLLPPLGVTLNAWFTTNGRWAKNCTHMQVVWTRNNIEWSWVWSLFRLGQNKSLKGKLYFVTVKLANCTWLPVLYSCDLRQGQFYCILNILDFWRLVKGWSTSLQVRRMQLLLLDSPNKRTKLTIWQQATSHYFLLFSQEHLKNHPKTVLKHVSQQVS